MITSQPRLRSLHRPRKLPRPLIIDILIDILPKGPGPILEINFDAYSFGITCISLWAYGAWAPGPHFLGERIFKKKTEKRRHMLCV